MLRITIQYEKKPGSFLRFMRWMNTALYLRYMSTSERYTVSEMMEYKAEQNMEDNEPIIDFEDGIHFFYALYNPDKQDVDGIIEYLGQKYEARRSHVFELLYKRYIDDGYDVDKDPSAFVGELVIL